MNIIVEIPVQNDWSEEITVRIPAGLIIEASPAAGRFQNVTVAQEYVFKLPPNYRGKVVVEGRCLNLMRSAPQSIPGKITPFRYAGNSFEQSAIWDTVSVPKK